MSPRPFAMGLNRRRPTAVDLVVGEPEPDANDVSGLVAWYAQLEHDGQRFEPAPYHRELLKALADAGDLPTLTEHLITARRTAKTERAIEAIAHALLSGQRLAVAGESQRAKDLLRAGAQRARLYAETLGIDLPADVEQLLTMTPGKDVPPCNS